VTLIRIKLDNIRGLSCHYDTVVGHQQIMQLVVIIWVTTSFSPYHRLSVILSVKMREYFVFEISICLDKFCWIYARHKYTFTLHGFHENSYLVTRASQILKSSEYHWFVVVQDVSTGRCYFRGWRGVQWLCPSCPAISSQTKWTLEHVVFPLSFLGPLTNLNC